MEINGEPVRLVEKFEDLKTGTTVYVFCRWHPDTKPHRGMLGNLKIEPSTITHDGIRLTNVPARAMLPMPQQHPSFVITQPSVQLKIVYEIIDEKFEAEQNAQSILKPKQIRKVASNVK